MLPATRLSVPPRQRARLVGPALFARSPCRVYLYWGSSVCHNWPRVFALLRTAVPAAGPRAESGGVAHGEMHCDMCGRLAPCARSTRYAGRNGRSVWSCARCEGQRRVPRVPRRVRRSTRDVPPVVVAWAVVGVVVGCWVDVRLGSRSIVAPVVAGWLAVCAMSVAAVVRRGLRQRSAVAAARRRVRSVPRGRHARP